MAKLDLELASNWEIMMHKAVAAYLRHYRVDVLHAAGTPRRVVSAMKEAVEGYAGNPSAALGTTFAYAGSQMIHVRDIHFSSMCAHHLRDIVGRAHFAYVPNKHVVGLSKIPRLIEIFARRLQVQEEMGDQIVDAFMEDVRPHGCGIHIRAAHCCMVARGVRAHGALMETTPVRGTFLSDPTQRAEFLGALDRSKDIL